MTNYRLGAIAVAIVSATLLAEAQTASPDVARHVAAARAAAGEEYSGLFERSCTPEGAIAAAIAPKPAVAKPPGRRAEAPGPPAKSNVGSAAGQGLRQSLLRRREGILGVGGDHVRRHHHHRHHLRVLRRQPDRGRPSFVRPRSRHDQVRHRQPRAPRSLGRREPPAGLIQDRACCCRRPTGTCWPRIREIRRSPSATWSSPMVRSSRLAGRR